VFFNTFFVLFTPSPFRFSPPPVVEVVEGGSLGTSNGGGLGGLGTKRPPPAPTPDIALARQLKRFFPPPRGPDGRPVLPFALRGKGEPGSREATEGACAEPFFFFLFFCFSKIMFELNTSNFLPLATASVISLGHVVHDRSSFHTDKYLWPVGFVSTRLFASMIVPGKRVRYRCLITDGGDAPLFSIEAEDDPGNAVTGKTATAVWTIVLKRVQEVKKEANVGRRTFSNISGCEVR
jgi:hypothetical protein